MSVVSTAPHSVPSPSDSLVARAARAALFKGLARLADGSLAWADSIGSRLFGSPTSDGLHAQVTVHDGRVYRRVALGGSLAAAEAYLDRQWSCNDLTALFRLLIRNPHAIGGMDGGLARLAGWVTRAAHALRGNSRAGSRRNIAAHYDLGNEFFGLFLDETLMYSSAIFPRPNSTLHEASLEKLDRVCRQLELSCRDHLLEIGTGWGGLALHAAGQYGCQVTTTTISRKQYDLAVERVAAAGLADRVTVLRSDYRDLQGTYDKLVSIEMIEAVGHRYLDTFFRQCARLLKPDGKMLLQGIVMNEQFYERYLRSVDFIQQHIFPGGCLPSIQALLTSVGRTTDMRVVSLADHAAHYAQTLRCWRSRFQGAIDEVRRLGFSDRMIRTWDYYFCYCEAAFEERYTGLVHLLLERTPSRSSETAAQS